MSLALMNENEEPLPILEEFLKGNLPHHLPNIWGGKNFRHILFIAKSYMYIFQHSEIM
jgi:hypothetical protein